MQREIEYMYDLLMKALNYKNAKGYQTTLQTSFENIIKPIDI